VSIKKRQKQHRNVTPFENPPRVLVVEDNIINQQVAVRMLRRLNIVPVVVDNGLHAVREMKENEYDLILMDFHMPVMDGLEATRQIRKLSGIRSSIPIVAMTASAIESEKQACLNAGMDGFLSKPIYAAPLAKQLRRFSPKSQQHQVIKIPEVKSDPVLPVLLYAKKQ
jgi:CheY-like chemotaxis protein